MSPRTLAIAVPRGMTLASGRSHGNAAAGSAIRRPDAGADAWLDVDGGADAGARHGANTAVFGFVDALLFRPAPGVHAPGRVMTVFTSDFSSGPYGDTSYPDFISIADEVPAFESVAAEDDNLVAPIRIGEEVDRVRVARVSGGYFGDARRRHEARAAARRRRRRVGRGRTSSSSAIISGRARSASESSVLGTTVTLNGARRHDRRRGASRGSAGWIWDARSTSGCRWFLRTPRPRRAATGVSPSSAA